MMSSIPMGVGTAKAGDWRNRRSERPSDRFPGEDAGRQVRGSADLAKSSPRHIGVPLVTLLLAILFLLSLLWPISFWVGPMQMKPYRIVLLVLFFPRLVGLVSGPGDAPGLVSAHSTGCRTV